MATSTQTIVTTFSGLIPESNARSSLSEKALIDLPVRVLFKNQNKAATIIIAATNVMTCDKRIARPSFNPVIALKSRALIKNRVPSANRRSPGPMINRTSPFIMNVIPREAITKIMGLALTFR